MKNIGILLFLLIGSITLNAKTSSFSLISNTTSVDSVEYLNFYKENNPTKSYSTVIGNRVRVKTKGKKVIKGNIQDFNETNITVNGNTIPWDNIKNIRAEVPIHRNQKIWSGVSIAGGIGAMIASWELLQESKDWWEEAIEMFKSDYITISNSYFNYGGCCDSSNSFLFRSIIKHSRTSFFIKKISYEKI